MSRGAGKGNPQNVPLEVSVKFRDMLQNAKAAAGDTVYGKRIDKIISELQTKEKIIAEYGEREKAFKEIRAKAPSAFGIGGADLAKAQEYVLKNSITGVEAEAKTSFKVGWDKDAVIFDITCKEPEMNKLSSSINVYSGEYVAITIQTQRHSHYILEISPDGLIVEGNPGKNWKSLAQVKPERGADFWRLTVRIPVVGEAEAEADPNHRMSGEKPVADAPWFINVGRKRSIAAGKDEIQLFSVSPKKAWHATEYFGKLEIK
jgi:hypothetical protein